VKQKRFHVTVQCTAIISVDADTEVEALQLVEKARDAEKIPGYIFSTRTGALQIRDAVEVSSVDWNLYRDEVELERIEE